MKFLKIILADIIFEWYRVRSLFKPDHLHDLSDNYQNVVDSMNVPRGTNYAENHNNGEEDVRK